MLCVIPQIFKDASDNSDNDNRKQVKNLTKKLSYGLSDDELHFNIDLFWKEQTDFNNKNGSFDGDEFIW